MSALDPFGSQPPPQSRPPEPTPPVARPASSIAALVLLVVVFVVGVAVGQSGLLGRSSGTTHTPAPAARPRHRRHSRRAAASADALPGNFDLFLQALDVVRKNFVGWTDVTETDITYGAIRGMVEALGDTGHSVFLTPEEVQSEQNALDGSVVGIGVLLGDRNGQAIIVSVVSGSPAQAVGLKAGDEIAAVDGTSTAGLSPSADRNPGTWRGRHQGDRVHHPPIDRGAPRLPDHPRAYSHSGRVVDDGPRDDDRAPAPGPVLGRMRPMSSRQRSMGRSAPGRPRSSSICAATRVAMSTRRSSRRASSCTARTVYIRELADGQRIPVATNDDVNATDLPLVVLIDANTASSAEILAGALASAQRGPLVGQTTYGTGTVLLPFDLADGSSIRLAIERWLTPDGALIFGKGITPGVPVELAADGAQIEPDELRNVAADAVGAIKDGQLLRAIQLAGGSP